MAEVLIENAPQGVRAYYDKGIAAMERGNFDYAMDMLDAALKIEPRLLKVHKLLHVAAIQRAKKQPPGKLAVVRNMGKLFKVSALQRKEPLRALAFAEDLLRIDPFNWKFIKAICSAAETCGLPEVAIQTLEIQKDHAPKNLAVLERLARLYEEAKRFDLEYECRNDIVRLKPSDAAALKKLKDTAARMTMGNAGWQDAESFRDVLREESPKIKVAEKPDELKSFLAKVEQDPTNPAHRIALADAHERNKQYGKAIRTLEACLELKGGADAQIERKLALLHEQDIESKIARAEAAGDQETLSELRRQLAGLRIENAAQQVSRYPNDLHLRFEYGRLLHENGDFTEAIQQFQLAQRNPHYRIRALLHLARAFMSKEQPDIAQEHLETALSEHPEMDHIRKELLYELGTLHESMGTPGKALECFKEIYSVDIGYKDVAAKVEL